MCEGRVKAIVLSVKSERAGDGDGNLNGSDSDAGDMTSGGSVHSARVKAVLLAAGSQHMYQRRRSGRRNLLVSSWPPIQLADRPNGHVRRRWQCGKLKIERIKVSKTAHLGRDRIAQPPRNASKHCYWVYRPRQRCGRIKIVPTNVNRAEGIKNAYLTRIAVDSKT